MSCNINYTIIQSAGGNGGGPYTVQANTPSTGQVTITDTASGESFIVNLNQAIKLIDEDADTQVQLIEDGGGEGDQIQFIVDGTLVGTVEQLSDGNFKWIMSHAVSAITIGPSPISTLDRDNIEQLTAGYIVFNGDTEIMQYYDGSRWHNINTLYSKQLSLLSPSNTDEHTIFYTKKAITIESMLAVVVGSGSPSVTLNVKHDPDRSAAGNALVSGGGLIANDTTVGYEQSNFSDSDSTIPENSFVWVEIAGVSGTVDEVFFTLEYTIDE